MVLSILMKVHTDIKQVYSNSTVFQETGKCEEFLHYKRILVLNIDAAKRNHAF